MNNKEITKLAESVLFSDIIAEVTERKEETSHQSTTPVLSPMDFFEKPLDVEPPLEFQQQASAIQPAPASAPVVEEEPYDAEKNARALVYTLSSIDSLLLNTASYFKARSVAGGAAQLRKMKAALTKEFTGAELSDHEKRLIERFKSFKANLELLSGEITPKPTDINRLITMATDYCEDTQFKMGSGAAFWAAYSGSLVERITKIIVK